MKLSEATISDKLTALAELDGFKVGKMNDGNGDFEFPIIEGCIGQFKNYLTSYDAIIPLIQKQPRHIREFIRRENLIALEIEWYCDTPLQLADALLKGTKKFE